MIFNAIPPVRPVKSPVEPARPKQPRTQGTSAVKPTPPVPEPVADDLERHDTIPAPTWLGEPSEGIELG